MTNQLVVATKTRSLDEERWAFRKIMERSNLLLADERRSFPPNLLLDLASIGFLGLEGAQESGGLALTFPEALRIIEYVGSFDISIASTLIIHNFLASNAIRDFGTSELQAELLPQFTSGRHLGAFAITERSGGSDPRRTTSSCRTRDNTFCISGEKIWIGLAAWSSTIVTFAWSTDSRNEGRAGLSGFAVNQPSPGLSISAEHLTMGLRGRVQNTVLYDGVSVPFARLLGHEGGGWKIASQSMMTGRLALGAASLGAMRRALQIAIRYASRRSISTGKMITNPNVHAVLSECVLQFRVVENLMETIYRLCNHEGNQDNRISELFYLTCKIIVPEESGLVLDRTLQILGGRGFEETFLIARFFRDARVIRIFEGPTETLIAHLGRTVALAPFGELNDILVTRFKQPEIYARILCVLEQLGLQNRKSKSLPKDVLHRRTYLLGQVVSWAITLAATKQSNGDKTTLREDVRAYCEHRFTETILSVDRLLQCPKISLEIFATCEREFETKIGVPGENRHGVHVGADEFFA